MIKHINIDPNGICNAKCWYCPVAYLGNPKENRGVMSIETMESILSQIDAGRGDFVDPNIDIYNNPIHYNETLLYPYFEEMLELHRKYNIKMYLFSNGVNLTPDKSDLVKKYKDVVTDIILNVPSIEREQWAKFTGFNSKIFDKLLNNLNYANNNLSDFFKDGQLMILVNGLNDESIKNKTDLLNVLNDAPEYALGELNKIVDSMRRLFPNILIVPRDNLSDRVGILSKLNVISNQERILSHKDAEVIGCGYGMGYPEHELFISATGNVYLCCADFSYESVYANISGKTIKEVWESAERKKMIKKSFSSMCRSCMGAIWSDGYVPNTKSQQGLNL
jgi:radical SAM protein with 4Fe4S-binding SPASM domain